MATSEEVWEALRQFIAETDRRAQENDRRAQEHERLILEQKAENDRRAQEYERLILEQKAENDRRAQENDRRAQEHERLILEQKAENDRRAQENDRRTQETDRQLRELGKQIGGLGSKFGSFTEGLALPSMDRILRKQFGIEVVSPRVHTTKNGSHMEIDVLGYSNGTVNAAYIVEVKSHVREESIVQLKTLLEQFKTFFPEHATKQVYGILAAVDLTEKLKAQILAQGIYVARIHDDVFQLDTPEDFHPRIWG